MEEKSSDTLEKIQQAALEEFPKRASLALLCGRLSKMLA